MIDRVRLLNIKSFKDASIPFGPFTLVIGANAAGKSNLRDALRFMHGLGLGYSAPEVLGDRYGPGGILQWRGLRGGAEEWGYWQAKQWGFRLEVTTSAELPRLEWIGGFEERNQREGPKLTLDALIRGETSYYHEFRAGFEQVLALLSPSPLLVEARKVVEFERASRTSRWPRHPLNLNEAHRIHPLFHFVAEEWGVPADEAEARLMVECLQSMRFLDLDPEAMRLPSNPGQDILGDRGENLSSVLLAISNDPVAKEILLSWVRALTPMEAVDLEFIEIFGGRVLLRLVEANGRRTSALSASDGTLRFLALVAALLSPKTGKFFFFEEIDNGIHPTRLPLLLDLIQRTCKERDIQVVATSHNPALLGFLDEEARNDALLVYRPEDAPDSRVKRIGDLPGIKEVLQKRDLGALHVSGWLEIAAVMSEPETADQDGDLT